MKVWSNILNVYIVAIQIRSLREQGHVLEKGGTNLGRGHYELRILEGAARIGNQVR